MPLQLYMRPATPLVRDEDPPEFFLSLTCGEWSHHAFHRFRRKLAEAEGFELDDMEGFADPMQALADRLHSHRPRGWETVRTPLKTLLRHSDADGSIDADACAETWRRLKAAVLMWDEDDYDRVQGERLARGMEVIARRGGRIDFR